MSSCAICACLDGFSYLLSFPGALIHPAHYRFLMESPLAADSEAWNRALSGQLVHGGRMNLQQVADFFQGQEGIISHGIDASFVGNLEAMLEYARNSRAEKPLEIWCIYWA